MTATYTDQSGTYVTTITREEWERERAKSDEVHVVQHEYSYGSES